MSVPSAFSMTLGLLPSITATHEFVVPKSIPMILKVREKIKMGNWEKVVLTLRSFSGTGGGVIFLMRSFVFLRVTLTCFVLSEMMIAG